MKKINLLIFLASLYFVVGAQQASFWELSGNANTAGKCFLGTTDGAPLIFNTNNIERMRLLSAGPFLGIGTSNPQATLHLHFDSKENTQIKRMLQLTTPTTGSNFNNGFGIYYNPEKDIFLKQYEEAKLSLEGFVGGLTIAPNGFVGIGTDDPRASLHLYYQPTILPPKDVDDPKMVPLTLLRINGPTMGNGFFINTFGKNIDFIQGEQADLNIFGAKSSIHFSNNGYVSINVAQQASFYVNGSSRTEGLFSSHSVNIKRTNQVGGFDISYKNNNSDVFLQQIEQGSIHIKGPGGGLMIAPNGNIGFGTTIPKQKLHIIDGNILISKTSAKTVAPGSPNGSILFGADINDNFPMGKWGIEYLNGEDNCFGLNFWRPWNPGGGGWGNYYLVLADNGNVGIGKKNPEALLDVNGSFRTKSAVINGSLTAQSATVTGNISIREGNNFCLSLGSAEGQNLAWGSSYIGFNAKRNHTTGSWTLESDGANNGGAVIWSSVCGAINFASIPRSANNSTNSQTLTDANIKGNIKLQLHSNGVLKTKGVQVTLANWPDYVFADDYKLMPLHEVRQYIKENSRLPNIPSAQEVEEEGVELGEMQSKLLLKIEELTLYILDLQNQIDELKTR